MTRGKSSRVPDIDELRFRFEQWRQTRRGRVRIPDELWSAAAAMARRDGVNKTAAALRLDGGKLKRRMAAADAHPHKAVPPAFVEFVASAADGAPEYTVEMEGNHGKLRIHSRGATAADLAELSRALWGLTA